MKLICKYRIRYFYSKGAALVLVWSFLVSVIFCSLFYTVSNVSNNRFNSIYYIRTYFAQCVNSPYIWLAC